MQPHTNADISVCREIKKNTIASKSRFQEKNTGRLKEFKNKNEIVKEIVPTLNETKTQSNKVILNCLANKMRMLSLKLQNPGEEKTIKKKIRNILSQLSTNVSGSDKESRVTSQSTKRNIKQKWKSDTKKIETPKYYSRYKICRLKEILMTWVENLTKNDFAEKNKEIFNYVYEKLEPTVLGRQKSITQYTAALKSIITNIINDLPVLFKVSNKEINLLSILNEIISIDDNIPITYIQPTTNEIIQFVKDEVSYFIPNSVTAINNNERMNILQSKLTEYLLDITDNEEEDKYLIDEIIHLLQDIAKITDEKAQYLANIIINDYKAFFFRRNQFSKKERSKDVEHDYFPLFKENLVAIDNNKPQDYKKYKEMLIKEIYSWLQGIKISTLDKHSKELVIENLANDIIDRYKYLKMEGDIVNDFEIKKELYKEYDANTLENAKKGLEVIKKISKPLFVATHESCVQNLKDQIFTWFRSLPSHIHDLEEITNIKQLVNNLAGVIKNVVLSKDLRTINSKIHEWLTNTFNGKLDMEYTENLNKMIKSTSLYQLAFAQIYPKNEEEIVDEYERIIDEWVDSLLLYSIRDAKFTNLKKHYIQELAIILYFNLDRLSQSPADEITKTMQDLISDWLKKISLRIKIKNINERQNYALELVRKIQALNHKELMETTDQKIDEESRADSVEAWINKLPLKITDFDSFHNQKTRFIANIKYLKNSGSDDNTVVNEIIKFMKTLPMEVDSKSNDRYLDGKANNFLQSLSNRSVDRKRIAKEHDIIEAVGDVIEDWVRNLPIEPVYNPKYICLLMNEITSVITTIIKHSQLNLNIENEDHKLKDKIIRFLLKLPLGLAQISALQLAEITNNLVEALKEIYSNEIDRTQKYVKPNKNFKETNVSIYDVITKRKSSKSDSVKSKKSNSSNQKCTNEIEEDLNTTQKNDKLKKNGQIKQENISNPVAKSKGGRDESSQVSGIERSSFAKSTDTISSGIQSRPQNTKERIFEKYQNILKEKIAELPIDTPTPESERLADLARTGIFNGILKTFFRLKSDPEIQNDYAYFELILEDRLDDMLDLLPQTDQMKTFRNSWKPGILSNVLDMLKELQDVTDRPSFKQRLKNGFNRQFAKRFELEQCFMLQQGFLAEMADAYILHTKYKEEDPMRANIYKQRLMKEVDELANHLMREHNTEFRFLKKSKLIEYAMEAMESVPIPRDDILDEEIEELLLVEEIEKWYNGLPISPYLNDFDVVFRKRMIGLLAKKLHEIEKDNDEYSKEGQMKHEMSKFLTERGRLEPDQDLNINMMVDELADRLRNRQLNVTTDYDVFEQNNPISSTFAKRNGNITPFENIHDTNNKYNVSQNTSQRQRIDTNQYPQFVNGNLTGNQGIPYQWPSIRNHTVSEIRPTPTPGNQIIDQITSNNSPATHHYQIRNQPDPNPYSGQYKEKRLPYLSLRLDHSQASFKERLYDKNQRNQETTKFNIHHSIHNERNSINQRQRSQTTDSSDYTNQNDAYRNGNEYGEMLRENDENASQARAMRPSVRFSINAEENMSPDYVEGVTARIGSKNEGRACIDAARTRLGIKCRCMERSRKTRRICVDSHPCPSSGLPCLCPY